MTTQIKKNHKVISLAISAFLFISICSGTIRAQGFTPSGTTSWDCFTTFDPNSNSGTCNNTTCADDGESCNICFDISLFSCDDNGEQPDEFQISSDQCFTVCDHNSTPLWSVGSITSCASGNKQIAWNGVGGHMSTTNGGPFTICGSDASQQYSISLIHEQGTPCKQPCNPAAIQSDN